MPAGVAHEPVDLAAVLPPVGQGHVDHVARDRRHRDRLRDRVERHHDHRVGQRRRPARRPSPCRSAARSRAGRRAWPWGRGWARATASGDADGSTAKSGSLASTGGAVSVGTHAPPSATGANTSVAASRASTVRPAMTSCGPRTMSTEIASAAMVVAARRDRGDDASRADREQPPADDAAPRRRGSPSAPPGRTAGPRARSRSLVAARRTRASSRISSGPPSSSAHFQRPAARWPRPGKMALSSRKRGACEGGSPAGDDGVSPAWTGSSDIAGKDAVDRRMPQPDPRPSRRGGSMDIGLR